MSSLKIDDSLFDFIDDDVRPWVKNNLKMSEIVLYGKSIHPIDILYELLIGFYPLHKVSSVRKETEQARIRSKLKRIRDFFNENKLECPESWSILYEKNQDDQEFLECINFVLIIFQNHVLKAKVTYYTNKQINQLEEMLEIQEANKFYRKKLQAILVYAQSHSNLKYCSEIEKFITTEPDLFKVE